MDNNVSAKLLSNLVQEKYSIYKSSFNSLLSVLGDNNQEQKLNANLSLFNASNDLSNILANSDRPSWLNETIGFTSKFKSQNKSPTSIMSGSSWSLLQRAIKIYKEAMEHSWDFTKSANSHEYDFDEIYTKYRDNSDLTTLFNSLIDTLNKMIQSNEIDSIKAISILSDLIATLEKNKNSSYFSTMASWEFVKNFTKNYAWEQISNIPGIKSLKKSFEKTMSDMDMEMDKLHKDFSLEIKNRYNMTIQSVLQYKNSEQLSIEDSKDNTK